MWRDLHEERDRSPEEDALILEACRLVGRLDALDVGVRESPLNVELAREARLTAGQLRGLVAELRQHDSGPATPPAGVGPAVEEDPLDELGARRKDRLAGSADL